MEPRRPDPPEIHDAKWFLASSIPESEFSFPDIKLMSSGAYGSFSFVALKLKSLPSHKIVDESPGLSICFFTSKDS